MAAPPPQEVVDAIEAETTDISYRCEIFESDCVTRFAGGAYDDRLLSGSVSLDYSRAERRTCGGLTVSNHDGALSVGPGSLWYDKVFKPVYTITYGGGLAYDFPLGMFVPDDLTQPHFPDVIVMSGRDLTRRALKSRFAVGTTFSAGSSPESIIGALASASGMTRKSLPVTGLTTGKDFAFEADADRWTAMDTVAKAYDHDIWVDASGYLRMTPIQDPVTSPLVGNLRTGETGNLVTYSKKVGDARLYNHVVVVGDTSDANTLPVWAEATNTEPSSPTNISRLGDITYRYTSSFITTTEQAQAVADSFLKIHALEEFSLEFGSLCYPWYEPGYIVSFDDPKTLTTTRMLLGTLDIPIGLAGMTGTGRRVTLVG